MMTTSMQQVQLQSYGGPEVLNLTETTIPQAGPGEVLIDVEAAGVNFSDVLRRRNTYFMPTPLPYVLGAEAVGQIVEVGAGVDNPALKPGQRILGILPHGGAYAEFVTVPAQFCVPLPPHIDPAAATSIFVQGSTAHLILHQLVRDLEGKSILVHAAAGGVGSLLTQMAVMAGAKVIGTGSSEEKLARIEALGGIGVNYSQPNWVEKVVEANGGEKVDVVLEMVGGEIYSQSFGCLKQMGTMVVYGAASGQPGHHHSEGFVDEGHNLLSFNLAYFIRDRMADWQASLGAVIGLLAEGQLEVEVRHRYALKDVVQAHRDLETRKTTGKVVLLP